jgi:hypothetical protein
VEKKLQARLYYYYDTPWSRPEIAPATTRARPVARQRDPQWEKTIKAKSKKEPPPDALRRARRRQTGGADAGRRGGEEGVSFIEEETYTTTF